MMARSLDNIAFLPQRLQRNILNFLPHQKVSTDLLGINENENETQLFMNEGKNFFFRSYNCK